MSTREVSNSDDVLDSRDVIARIEELEEEKEQFILEHATTEDDSPAWGELAEAQGTAEEEWDATSEGEELKALKALAEQCDGYGDWVYGEALIRDSYFEDYARELAEDLGYMSREGADRWPFTCIDWEKAAEELQMDYTQVDFDGVDYWIRA